MSVYGDWGYTYNSNETNREGYNDISSSFFNSFRNTTLNNQVRTLPITSTHYLDTLESEYRDLVRRLPAVINAYGCEVIPDGGLPYPVNYLAPDYQRARNEAALASQAYNEAVLASQTYHDYESREHRPRYRSRRSRRHYY